MEGDSYYLKVAKGPMSGLCNQIYSLCGCIEFCINSKLKKIYVDSFLMEINTDFRCPLSEIINLKKLNAFTNQYGIEIIEHNKEDKHKESPIKYFGESANPKLFTKILNNIPFLEKYEEISKKQIKYDNFNTIHLRLEKDAIDIYSKEMGIHPDVYKKICENRYIHCIKKYIDKNTMSILLTSETDNKVVEYLKNNGYRFTTTQKTFQYRELNALVDLLTGVRCNRIFIGSHESSFSFTILNRILLKRQEEFLGFCLDLNKYYDFYRTYTKDNYTEYINNNNIRELIYIPNGGEYRNY